MKKYLIMICSLFFAIVMVCFSTTSTVGALSDSCSLTLEFVDGETGALSGCNVRLYFIAEGYLTGYQLTEAFAEMKADVEQMDWNSSEEMAEHADALSAYLTDKGIVPDQTGVTDSEGRTSFADLSWGLYLAIGDNVVKDGWSYRFQPTLVWLPCEGENGEMDYAPVCITKYEKTKFIDISVVKVWVDDGNHPSSVTVQLLCDGEVYDKVTLNEENGWEYVWEGLEDAHDWQIEEINIPDGYFARVTKHNNDFTVTNTKKLPQTGQLWWPVPLMLFAGALLLLIGLYLLMRGSKKVGGTDSES